LFGVDDDVQLGSHAAHLPAHLHAAATVPQHQVDQRQVDGPLPQDRQGLLARRGHAGHGHGLRVFDDPGDPLPLHEPVVEDQDVDCGGFVSSLSCHDNDFTPDGVC
jgi:hypothetical protein